LTGLALDRLACRRLGQLGLFNVPDALQIKLLMPSLDILGLNVLDADRMEKFLVHFFHDLKQVALELIQPL
jgi:hypothetical protein